MGEIKKQPTRKLESREKLEKLLGKKVVNVGGIGPMRHKVIDGKKGEMFFVGKGSGDSIKYVSILKENIDVENGNLLFNKPYSTAEISNQRSLFYRNWYKALKEAGF